MVKCAWIMYQMVASWTLSTVVDIAGNRCLRRWRRLMLSWKIVVGHFVLLRRTMRSLTIVDIQVVKGAVGSECISPVFVSVLLWHIWEVVDGFEMCIMIAHLHARWSTAS